MSNFDLAALAAIIRARRASESDASYTRMLLDGGPEICAKKLGEEATEVIIAAMQGGSESLRNEAADLLYHLLVLLETSDVRFEDVLAELERRTGQSGLAEKAARSVK